MIAEWVQEKAAYDWIEARLGYPMGPNTQLIGVRTDTGYAGIVSFGGWMGRTMTGLGIAVDDERAMLPLIRASAVYLFRQLRAEAVYTTVSGKRLEWQASLRRVLGFREVDRVRNGYGPGDDFVVMKITAATCRPWQAFLAKQRRQLLEVA